MKLSIIIPVFNTFHYLRACVQSVCEQSGMEIEVLLIDDASDDGSGDLCDKLANEYPNVRVFHTEKGGLSVARNIGIKNAQGDYVAFLDSDDCWLPIHEWSQIMAKMQEQNEVIFFDVVHKYEGSLQFQKPLRLFSHTSKSDLFTTLIAQNQLHTSACFQFLQRKFLIDNNLFFEPNLYSEDIDWTLRLWQNAKSMAKIDQYIYVYCHRKGSISTSFLFKNLLSYDWIFTTWKQKKLSNDWQKATFMYLANMFVSCLYLFYRVEERHRQEAKRILQTHSDLLQYGITPKVKRARALQRWLGFSAMVQILAVYGYFRYL